MTETDILLSLFAAVPDFAFALALFYLCQRNADKQRESYLELLSNYHNLFDDMLKAMRERIAKQNIPTD